MSAVNTKTTNNLPLTSGTAQSGIPNTPLLETWKIQNGLMIGAIAFTTLSIIPIPIVRTVGSFALRSITLITTTIPLTTWLKDDRMTQVSKILKVGAVALGLTGVILKTPVYTIASLVTDTVHQALEMIKQPNDNSIGLDSRALIIITNILVISAIALASWELIIVASLVNVLALFFIAGNTESEHHAWLALLNFLSVAVLAINITPNGPTVSYTNKTDHNQRILKGTQNDIDVIYATLKPGETFTHNANCPCIAALYIPETAGNIRFSDVAVKVAANTEVNVQPAEIAIGGPTIPEANLSDD